MKNQGKIMDKFLPYGSDRRKMYELGIIGTKILANDGWRIFWSKFKDYRNSNRLLCRDPISLPIINIPINNSSENLTLIEKKVSIIIPTKNAGKDFDITLNKIRSQIGIDEIELIIVDSGSTDKTIQLAETYGSKVYKIESEKFNHGGTRNYGAEQATGDYFLFMVQDAIPIGNHWLYDIITALECDEEISAATCRQIPRSNADLIATYSIWNHYCDMEFDEDRIAQLPEGGIGKLSLTEKRKLSGIEDVCTCIKKDIFNKFKFKNIGFGEDLELGMRLIENGHKILFLHSAGVIHSHTRDSMYIMKRYYVDTKFLNEMFDITPRIKEKDVDLVLISTSCLYISLKKAISVLRSNYGGQIDIDVFFLTLKDLMTKDMKNQVSDSDEGRNDELEVLMSYFEKMSDSKYVETSLLLVNYLILLENFHKYLNRIYKSYELNDLIESSYKLFSISVGSYFGDLSRHRSEDEKFQQIDALLTRGV